MRDMLSWMTSRENPLRMSSPHTTVSYGPDIWNPHQTWFRSTLGQHIHICHFCHHNGNYEHHQCVNMTPSFELYFDYILCFQYDSTHIFWFNPDLHIQFDSFIPIQPTIYHLNQIFYSILFIISDDIWLIFLFWF